MCVPGGIQLCQQCLAPNSPFTYDLWSRNTKFIIRGLLFEYRIHREAATTAYVSFQPKKNGVITCFIQLVAYCWWCISYRIGFNWINFDNGVSATVRVVRTHTHRTAPHTHTFIHRQSSRSNAIIADNNMRAAECAVDVQLMVKRIKLEIWLNSTQTADTRKLSISRLGNRIERL